MKIGLLSIPDANTTARYFERAAIAYGHELTIIEELRSTQTLQDLDCLIVIDPALSGLSILRQAPCMTIGYMIDVHQHLEYRLTFSKYLDHVFVAQPEYVDRFKSLPHASVHWLPLACDPDTHFVPGERRLYDLGFVGKLGRRGSDRHATLTRVLPQFSTNNTARMYSPREMGKTYSQSRIVFNKSINGDLNMRFFEAMAAGALLITDRIGNGLDRIGRDGEHYVTYADAEEAADKIRYFLANDVERDRIAQAGQRLVFAAHTYSCRLNEMLSVAARYATCRSPARTAPPSIESVWRSEFMRINGARGLDAVALIAEGPLSGEIVINSAVAVARGIVRPLRQRLAAGRRP